MEHDNSKEKSNRPDGIFDLNALLHPARAFAHPMDVVRDIDLTLNEKRAILASWASDACAIEAAPGLRINTAGKAVRWDDIMDALKHLDGEVVERPHYRKLIGRAQRWKDLYRGERCGRSPFA